MVSARRMVDRRWAMTKEVRPRISSARPSWISASLSLSSDEVASSRIRMRGLARMALALAAGELHSPLADHRVVALRQPAHEVVAMRDLGGAQDLGRGGVGSGVGDVLEHRPVEQEVVLEDHAEMRAVVEQ